MNPATTPNWLFGKTLSAIAGKFTFRKIPDWPIWRGEGLVIPALQESGLAVLVKFFSKPSSNRVVRLAQLHRLNLSAADEWLFKAMPIGWGQATLDDNQVYDYSVLPHLGIAHSAMRLDAWIAQSPEKKALRIRKALVCELWCIVQHLERRGLRHCDLSQQNLMVTVGPDDVPWLNLIDVENICGTGIDPIPADERILGAHGYQYPALRDGKVTEVQTDRFAAAVLSCEIMTAYVLEQVHGAESLFEIQACEAPIPYALRQVWPAGFALLDRAIHAPQPAHMPAPAEWIRAVLG